jgi:hypothetical protein
MNRTASTVLTTIFVASLGGCSSPIPEKDQIAREGAERDALVSAAHAHPAMRGEKDAVGKPLPPLPGVDVPAPKSTSTHAHEPEHDHP